MHSQKYETLVSSNNSLNANNVQHMKAHTSKHMHQLDSTENLALHCGESVCIICVVLVYQKER